MHIKIIKSAPTSKNIIHRLSSVVIESPYSNDFAHIVSNYIHYIIPNERRLSERNNIQSLMHNISHAYPSSFTHEINNSNVPLVIYQNDFIPHIRNIGVYHNRELLLRSGEPLYRKVHQLVANHLYNTNGDIKVLGDYAEENPDKFKDLVPNIHELQSTDAAKSILTNFLHNNYMDFILTHNTNRYTSNTLPHNYIINPVNFTQHLLNNSQKSKDIHAFITPSLENLRNREHNPLSGEELNNRLFGYTSGNIHW